MTAHLNPTQLTDFQRRAAHAISRDVLQELAPEEFDVAVGFLDPLIEMAADGELWAIGSDDIAGGFGSVDVLFSTIVPAVVRALVVLDSSRAGEGPVNGQEIETALRGIEGDLEGIVREVGSQRAMAQLDELLRAIREATKARLANG